MVISNLKATNSLVDFTAHATCMSQDEAFSTLQTEAQATFSEFVVPRYEELRLLTLDELIR